MMNALVGVNKVTTVNQSCCELCPESNVHPRVYNQRSVQSTTLEVTHKAGGVGADHEARGLACESGCAACARGLGGDQQTASYWN